MVLPAMGQKPLKGIKAALKSNKPLDALKLIEQYRKDSVWASHAQLYAYGVEASHRLNDIENEKIYLKRKPDTVAFFKTIYNTFEYALLTDSVARASKSNNKFRKAHLALLQQFYPHFNAAVRYFQSKGKMEDAAQYARLAIEVTDAPLFSEAAVHVSDTLMTRYAERYLLASYALKRYAECERFVHLALRDTARMALLLETLVLANEEMGDTADVYRYLSQGVERFPRQMFFFQGLTDYFFQRRAFDSILHLSARLLVADPDNPTLYEARARVFEMQGEDSLCIVEARQVLRCDTANVRADYYLGASYLRLAQKVEMPTSINAPSYKEHYQRRQYLYAKARPYLEFYRKNAPEKSEVWKPLLYEVYLHLNLGKEFEEISK